MIKRERLSNGQPFLSRFPLLELIHLNLNSKRKQYSEKQNIGQGFNKYFNKPYLNIPYLNTSY